MEETIRRYQLDSFNLVHFYRDGLFIGAFLLTEPSAQIEYEANTKISIFVNIKLKNANIHFICDKFEVLRAPSQTTPVFEVTINKDGDIKWL